MKRRKAVIYVFFGIISLSVVFALYFFFKKPIKISPPVFDQEKKAVVFKDVKYSGEKKGIIDWEINAKIARKYIDKPAIDMEDITGLYKPRENVTVYFDGTKGSMDTEADRGRVEDVDITYKDNYRLKSKHMDFDFKEGVTSTSAPVHIEGKKLTLRGVGLRAVTSEETVLIERDVSGYIETEKGKYRFESDRFLYNLKDAAYVLEGKVIMKGEDMNLLCNKLFIHSRDNDVEFIDAIGKVMLLSKGTIAKSEKAVYHFKENKVIFTERPKIVKDNVEMEGEIVVYNLNDKKFSIQKPKMRMEK